MVTLYMSISCVYVVINLSNKWISVLLHSYMADFCKFSHIILYLLVNTVYWKSFVEENIRKYSLVFSFMRNVCELSYLKKPEKWGAPTIGHFLQTGNDFFQFPFEIKGRLHDKMWQEFWCASHKKVPTFKRNWNPRYLVLPTLIDVDT